MTIPYPQSTQTGEPVAVPGLEGLAAAPFTHDALMANGVFGFASRDIRSRSFNLLRSQMLKILRRQNWKLIGICSATPGVGKSFIACNLAAALSRVAGLQVFLADLDLRRPAIHKYFGLQPERGIIDYLQGDAPDLLSVATRLEGERLVILPSVPSNAASAELLVNEAANRMFAGFRTLPDNAVAIFDLPPIFANDDAMIVSNRLDAALMVIEEGVTTRKQVQDANRLLYPTPLIGSVLNRYNGGLAADDYGYGYGYDTSYSYSVGAGQA
jgi:protein-tyrosine kinase